MATVNHGYSKVPAWHKHLGFDHRRRPVSYLVVCDDCGDRPLLPRTHAYYSHPILAVLERHTPHAARCLLKMRPWRALCSVAAYPRLPPSSPAPTIHVIIIFHRHTSTYSPMYLKHRPSPHVFSPSLLLEQKPSKAQASCRKNAYQQLSIDREQ